MANAAPVPPEHPQHLLQLIGDAKAALQGFQLSRGSISFTECPDLRLFARPHQPSCIAYPGGAAGLHKRYSTLLLCRLHLGEGIQLDAAVSDIRDRANPIRGPFRRCAGRG